MMARLRDINIVSKVVHKNQAEGFNQTWGSIKPHNIYTEYSI